MPTVLSPFPYFGGKFRMAPMICELIASAPPNVTLFGDVFGGAGRILLNSQRFHEEIYNDASAGLAAFFEAMSKPDTAQEVINKLFETEYSPDEFYRALALYNSVTDNYLREFKRQTVSYLYKLSQRHGHTFDDLKKAISLNKIADARQAYDRAISSGLLTQNEIDVLALYKAQLEQCIPIYNAKYISYYRQQLRAEFEGSKSFSIAKLEKSILHQANPDIREQYIKECSKISALKYKDLDKQMLGKIKAHAKRNVSKWIENEVFDNADDNISFADIWKNGNKLLTDDQISNVDLAVATYIVYSQGRDGLGRDWSDRKYISTEHYHKGIERLYAVSERMQGVVVTQAGALTFLLEQSHLNNENALFFLDPSYLDPDDEGNDLGSQYKLSFSYEDHELLVRTICEAKCNIILTNYDLKLYNRYLTPERGWSKIEFETFTNVGGQTTNSAKGSDRLEIIYYKFNN